MKQKVIIIGGGAAGFFAAVQAKANHPKAEVTIFEKAKKLLAKVKISGGGRCNVTHACFDPAELVRYYPRGNKELLGPFHQFATGDTMQWFEDRGVQLKIEADNRVFPISNSSQTIIDCLLDASQKAGISLKLGENVTHISKIDHRYKITTNSDVFNADALIIATGSSPKFWDLLNTFDHTIVNPVPSLFTFKINDKRIKEIP